ncbi:MAG: RIO1 family regulatory kinase/ATPase [Chloroflexota bacterium]
MAAFPGSQTTEHRQLHTETLGDALDPFIADGLIEHILYPIKSGKEATVYCCRAGPALKVDLVAAKVYKARAFRSFRDDSIYREGRVILDARARRAAGKRTPFGHKVQSALWTNHEWDVLRTLHPAGADVPEPIAQSAGAIVLEFVGDAGSAAPVLKDVRLTTTEAEALFERLLDNVQLWLAYNIVHGDLSPYNVLYRGKGYGTVIDFPQAVDPRSNTNAFQLLLRDIENLARFFERFGLSKDAFGLAQGYWAEWERP